MEVQKNFKQEKKAAIFPLPFHFPDSKWQIKVEQFTNVINWLA